MAKFKQASLNASEMKEASEELNNIVLDAVRVGGAESGRKEYNPRGIQKLEEAKWEVAELIYTIIRDTVTVTDPSAMLVDEVSGNLGDQHIFQEVDSALRVTKRSVGSKPLSQRLTKKEWGILTSQKEVNVELPLEQIAAGIWTASEIAEHIAFAITRSRIATLLDAIDAGVPSAADQTGVSGYTLRYTGLTSTTLDKAIDGLQDADDSPVIMGRHVAIAPKIRAFTGWSNDTLRELETRGMIGTYHGASVMTLKDRFSKWAKGHVIRADRVYMAGGMKGAIRKSVDVSFLNYAATDARSATFMTGVRFEDGVLVHSPNQYRIIEL